LTRTKNKRGTTTKKKATGEADQPKQFTLPRPEFRHAQQAEAWETIARNHISFLIGPAGTAKTFIATAYAVTHVLNSQRDMRIYFSRPAVEAGEHLGALPGTAAEKIQPYMQPIFDAVDKLTQGSGESAKEKLKQLTKTIPLAYMRGLTISDAVSILDEAQNATLQQLKLYLSRLGEGSKLIVCGDTSQSDLRWGSRLYDVVQSMKGIIGVGCYEFTAAAIVRHPLIGKVMERFESLEGSNERRTVD